MKTFYLTDSRFKFTAFLLMVIFFTFMVLFFRYGHELSVNPCSVCAEKMGDAVVCSVGPLSRTFYPNGTIVTSGDVQKTFLDKYDIQNLNNSKFNQTKSNNSI